MPIISGGTFKLWGGALSGTGDWTNNPSTFSLASATMPGHSGTVTFFFDNGSPLQLNSDPPITLGAAPAGFTPTTGLGGAIRPLGNSSDSTLTGNTYHASGAAGGPQTFTPTFANVVFLVSIPDGTSLFDLSTGLADFDATFVQTGGLVDGVVLQKDYAGLDGASAAPIRIQGSYGVEAFWWVLPTKDGCGNAQTPRLVLSPTSPGAGYALLDPVDPDTTSPTVVVDSVEPNHGLSAGGTAVTIRGSGFGDGASVAFDGVVATSIVVVSADEITCVSPAHALGTINVVVTNLDGSHN